MKKIKILIIIFLCLLLIPLIINTIVILKVNNKIYKEDELNKIDNYNIALVLGCGIKNNEPSLMLRDRLNTAIKLYEENKIQNILISGDEHDSYSETNVMYKYLIDNNIPSDIILIDNKGYNTSASIENYYHNYPDKSLIIITQKYHMYRSLYISDYYNLNYIGLTTKNTRYYGQFIRDIREVMARCKDFLKYLF